MRASARSSRATAVTTKYVGGVYYVRDYAGTGHLPLTPVPPEQQRAALKLVADGVFSANSFRFKPDFLRSMGIDYLDIGLQSRDGAFNPDFSLRSRVLGLQTAALNQLMSDTVMASAARFRDQGEEVGDQALTLSELFATLEASIWSELRDRRLDPGAAPRPAARAPAPDRQRADAARAPTTPADARALLREEAKQLSAQIKVAAANGNRDRETRAHLNEAANTLDEALKAPIIRQGA